MTSADIAQSATDRIGQDFTPDWVVPDEVSCAFAVTTILHQLDPEEPIIQSTATLLNHFLNSIDRWVRVYEPEAGCVIISATGTNSRPEVMAHGHTGIYLDTTRIASNDSNTGLWTQNYTRESWRQRYYYRGGYPVYLFKKL